MTMQSCCGRVFAEEASFDAHQGTVHPHPYRLTLHYPDALQGKLVEIVEYARAKALGSNRALPADWATVGAGGVEGAPSYITDPETPDPALKFTCPYCGRKFASQVALDFHEETSHADKLPPGQRSGASDSNSAHASQDKADKPESWNDIQQIVREELVEKYRDPTQNYCYIWVADIGEDWVVFEFKDEYFKIGYALDDNSNVTFNGRAVEVTRRTVYVPVTGDDDEENDGDPDDADAGAATGHKKKKNGRNQESHQKNGRAQYVYGMGPGVVTPNMDPDNDGDVDTPGAPDNDVKTS